jgi:hypothetical protein
MSTLWHVKWDRAKLEAASAPSATMPEGVTISLSPDDMFAIDSAMLDFARELEADQVRHQFHTIRALAFVWREAGGRGRGGSFNKSYGGRNRALASFVREVYRQADQEQHALSEHAIDDYLKPRFLPRRWARNQKRRKPPGC